MHIRCHIWMDFYPKMTVVHCVIRVSQPALTVAQCLIGHV